MHGLRPRNYVFALTLTLVAACLGDSPAMSSRPARLSAGLSDTVIVNFMSTQPLPIRALDANGRTLAAAAIRYVRVSGDSLPMTADGTLTCTRRADLVIRATLGTLTAPFVVRCRPVGTVRLKGPFQFVLGDSALSQPRLVPVAAYDSNRRAVVQLAGNLEVFDSRVASIRGSMLSPRARGITLLAAHVGSAGAWSGVHIYQRVESLVALDTALRVPPHQRLFAVPIRLRAGEFLRQRLPPGDWMLLTQASTPDGPKELKVRAEHAVCQENLLNDPGRIGCHSGSDADVIVYRPFAADSGYKKGYLLVRWLFQ
jgi:hypothetical protein